MIGVQFDSICSIGMKNKGNISDNYDVLLESIQAVCLIEVKYIVSSKDVSNLLTSKLEKFKILFPKYDKTCLYLAIAGMSFESDVEDFANNSGVVVLKQKGKTIEVKSDKMKVF